MPSGKRKGTTTPPPLRTAVLPCAVDSTANSVNRGSANALHTSTPSHAPIPDFTAQSLRTATRKTYR